jgi:hypothetical protein
MVIRLTPTVNNGNIYSDLYKIVSGNKGLFIEGGNGMKRKLAIIMGACLLLISGFLGKQDTAEAAGDYTNTELKVTRVEDITVYNEYKDTINNVSINTTLPNNRDGGHVYRFTLEQDGYVSLLISCKKMEKITEKTGANYSYSSAVTTLSATIYRDSGLLYPVTPIVTTDKVKNVGESPQKIALDKGTYYVALQTDKYSVSVNNNTTTTTYVIGTADFIIYYQPLESYEGYRPSIAGKENKLEMEAAFKGVLTVTNPKDYYKFELKDKALVKINFMYSSKNQAKFTLYSTEREELLTKTFSGNNVWYNVEKYLEPGTYYCSLETITKYDGGATSIQINPTVYPLDLEQVNQTTNSYVTVSTIDAPKEIRYVLGRLTNSELTSSKWNSGKVITDTLLFGVNKVGYYTVRVTDWYGNMFMQSIRVTNCDKNAPDMPVIKEYEAGTFVVSGTAEKNSFVTVYVNGKAYTCTATAKGAFKCTLPSKLVKGSLIEATAQDISGNISEKAEVMLE